MTSWFDKRVMLRRKLIETCFVSPLILSGIVSAETEDHEVDDITIKNESTSILDLRFKIRNETKGKTIFDKTVTLDSGEVVRYNTVFSGSDSDDYSATADIINENQEKTYKANEVASNPDIYGLIAEIERFGSLFLSDRHGDIERGLI